MPQQHLRKDHDWSSADGLPVRVPSEPDPLLAEPAFAVVLVKFSPSRSSRSA